MTLTSEAHTRTDDVQVRFDQAGKPLAIRHDGRIWIVDPDTESQHWFGRDDWWDTRRTAAMGSGDMVSVEYWRVQVRIESSVGSADLRPVPGSVIHAVAASWDH